MTIENVQITQATDDNIQVVVTSPGGTVFQDASGKPSQDTDGLNASNYYIIDVPLYDADDQPNGVQPGSTVVVHVFRDGREFTVSNPLNASFTVGASGSITAINLQAYNQPPVGVADTYSIDEDQALVIDSPGALSNDTDAEHNPLTAVLKTGPSHGTLSLNPNGSFSYTPSSSFNGQDNFTYVANDGSADSNAVQVAITVNPVNDAPTFTKGANQVANEDSGPKTVAGWATSISSGPADESGQILTFISTNDNGALFSAQPSIASNGTLTFTPSANGSGAATVTVILKDNGGAQTGGADSSSSQTFTITVNPVNDAPNFTKGANQVVNENSGPKTVAGWATGISSGPADENGQTLTFILTNDKNALFSVQPSIAPNGTLTFTPSANASGTATVTVILKDNGGAQNGGTDSSPPQTFTITVNPVNQPPVAVADTYSTDEDHALVINSPGALSNDTDAEQNPLTAVLKTGPAHGTLSLNPNGSFTYTPSSNFNGQDSFTYVANDGSLDSGAVQVTITVNPVNDAPNFTKGANQVVNGDSGPKTVAGWATGISSGPADESGQTLTFILTNDKNALFSAQPSIAPNGTLTFTPSADASGTATVTVILKDNGGNQNGGADSSPPQTFTITVNPVNQPPVAVADTYSTDEDHALVINSPGALSNDTDAEHNPLTAVLKTGPAHGTLSLNPNGSFSYTPSSNFNGQDNFTYVANDGSADSNAVQVTITVNPVNDAPGFTKGANQAVNEDSGLKTVAGWATGISSGPADESGQTLSFILTNSNNALFSAQPSISSNGTLTFTPSANANGAATVTVILKDNGGSQNGGADSSSPQTFTITVNPVNDAPDFTKGANQTVNEDSGPKTVAGWATSISSGPADESGQTLSFILTNSNNALFSAQPSIASNGTLTFTPAANANGAATVTVILKDNGGNQNGGADSSSPQTFTITVSPVNDAPNFTKGANQVVNRNSGPKTVAGWATGISSGPADESGQTLTFILTNDKNALFSAQPSIASNGTLTFTPAADASGTATVTVILKDNGGAQNGGADSSSPQTFTITVNPVNQPPVAVADTYSTDEDHALVIDSPGVLSNDTDAEHSPLTAVLKTGPAHGTFSLNPNGSFSYTPSSSFNGQDGFTYVANNGSADSNAAQVTITVNPVNDAPGFTKGANQAVNEDSGPKTVAEWATGIFSGPLDESGQTLSFILTNSNNVLFSAQPSIAPNGTLTFTPSANANGAATVTVILKDNGGAQNGGVDSSSPQTFTITVNPVNDAPNFTKGGNEVVNEDSGSKTVAGWATSISSGPADESSQTLTFLSTNDNNALFSVQPSIAPDGTLTLTPSADANGTATVTVILKDNGGAQNGGADSSPPQTFTITVDPVNDKPTISAITTQITAKNIPAGPIGFKIGDVDAQATDLTLSGTSSDTTLVPDGSISFAESGAYRTMTITPAQDRIGTTQITLTVGDGVSSSSTTFKLKVVENRKPVADAGPDQNVKPGVRVKLRGNNSTDPDGNKLTYLWKQVFGRVVKLSNPNVASPTFTAPALKKGSDHLVFVLEVTDLHGLTSKDTCTVNVSQTKKPPVADAGEEQVVAANTLVTLDGSKSLDPQGEPLTYKWTLIGGGKVTLSDPDTAMPTFDAPVSGKTGKTLIFRILVTNQACLMAEDICTVSVTNLNQPPDANAGGNKTVGQGDLVVLDGSSSTDYDGGMVSYRWTQVSGPPVKLSSPAAIQPTFTAPSLTTSQAVLTFRLTVVDSGGLVSEDICRVRVKGQ